MSVKATPAIRTVEVLDVRHDPSEYHYGPFEVFLSREWDDAPEHFRVTLSAIVDMGTDDAKCWRCEQPIGHVLTDWEGPDGNEYSDVKWKPLSLLWDPDADYRDRTVVFAVPVCMEHCSPTAQLTDPDDEHR